MAELTPFYAMRSRILKSEQLFKVYPTERGLAFAWIAGQINDEENARLMLQVMMLFLRGWVRCKLESMRQREFEYDSIDPESAEFLARDIRNFFVSKNEIKGIHLRRNSLGPHGIHSGSILVTLIDRIRQKFILIGRQPIDVIESTLREFFPELVATGKPSKWPEHTDKSRDQTLPPRWMAFVFMALGVLFVAASITIPMTVRQLVGNVVFTILNFGTGIYLLCKSRRAKPDDTIE